MGLKKEDIINSMVGIRENLNKLLDRKYEIIEQLKDDVENLKKSIREIDKFISINSILTAEQVFDTESFLKERNNSKIKNVDFTKKIFSKKNPEILLIIFKFNGENIDVFFPNSKIIQISPTSEVYLNSIIHPLMNLKESEKEMEIFIDNQNDLGQITKMAIKNIYSFNNVERIFGIFKKLVESLSTNKIEIK